MEKHPTNKEILYQLIKTGEVSKKILEHARSCEECSAKIKAVTDMLQPSDNSAVMPSDFIESRIINSYRSLKSGPEHKTSTAEILRRFTRPVIYAAASIIIILAVYIGFNYYQSLNFKDIPLALKIISGNAMINDKTAGQFNLVKSGSIIQMQKDSYADLYYDNIFSIRLAGETAVEIKKCLVNDKTPAYRLEFDIKNGAAFANFFHNVRKEYKLEYTFSTPAAEIESIGTEFLLQAANDNTLLIVREGQVKIISNISGKEITAEQGRKYLINSDINISDINDNDKSYMDSLLNPGAGTDSASQNKSPSVEKTAVKKSVQPDTNKPAVIETAPGNQPENKKENGSDKEEKNQPGENHERERIKSETDSMRREMMDAKKDIRKSKQSGKGMK